MFTSMELWMDGHKLKLQTPETMRLFSSTKQLIDKTKHGENVPSLDVIEVVLIQCNLVDNANKSQKYYVHLRLINRMLIF